MKLKASVWTILALVVGAAPLHPQSISHVSAQSGPVAFTKLPLTFEKNLGQAGSEVSFLSRGVGYTAYLTGGSMVLSLRSSVPANTSTSATPHATSATVQLALVGAAKDPVAVGEGLQTGKVNYFLGNDPTRWHTNVPTYSRVRYTNVYPGIDLLYYGSNDQLEYDFELQPGSDPRKIQFEVQGTSQITLDTKGNLVLALPGGEIHLQCPIVFQTVNNQRVIVDGNYVLTDATHVAFEVPHYDPSKPLVIDPVLLYATYLGGSGTDQSAGIAVDSTGSVYLTGYTDSINFPLATLGSLGEPYNHVFVAKFGPSGTNLIYADYIGGNNNDYGSALALDSANEVYVTGNTESSNFPVINNPYQSQPPGPSTGFLTRVSADGSSLLYSTYLGGSAYDQPTSIAVDGMGQAHIVGYTTSQNFPVVNAYQATVLPSQGGAYGGYGFATTFSSNDSSLIYSTYFAGNTTFAQQCGNGVCYYPPYTSVNSVAVDANGNAYIAGATSTLNLPTTAGTYQTNNNTQLGASIGFVGKFNSVGALDYSTYFYGSGGDPVWISGIAVDSSSSPYVTGTADSDGTFPIMNTSICNPSVSGFSCSYAFVTKFDSAAATLLYSTFLGPNNYATPLGIALDASDDAYVLASTLSPSFQINDGIEAYTNDEDMLLIEIDPAASTELFATYLGGNGIDIAGGLALDASGNMYVAGSTASTDLPVTQGAFQGELAGNTNIFVAEIGAGSNPTASVSPTTLQYSAQTVDSSSQPQVVELRNMSSMALSISSISVTGDFSESDSCGTSLPAAGDCAVSVTFTPTTPGPLSGTLQINDDATGSSQLVSLTGSGLGPLVALTPTTLSFPNTQVGSSSTSETVTLTNDGNAGLDISSIQITGGYTETNNCPSTLTTSCSINVVFAPIAPGNTAGVLTINDNAPGGSQSVFMSGIGTVPSASASVTPASLSFLGTQVGISSAAQTVTVTNQGNAALSITNIQITGDYSQTNNCPSTLVAGSSCSFNLTFTPTASGIRAGSLTITDNAGNSPQSVTLSGDGQDFGLASSSSSATVQPGATATYAVSVTPLGGTFTNSIKLACSGAPSLTACNLSSTSVIPGSTTDSITVTITTTGSSALAMPPASNQGQVLYAVWMPFQGLGVLGAVMLMGPKHKNKAFMTIMLFALLLSSVLFLTGCAGGLGIAAQTKQPATAPGTYTVTITGTAGTLQHSVPVTLVVQ